MAKVKKFSISQLIKCQKYARTTFELSFYVAHDPFLKSNSWSVDVLIERCEYMYAEHNKIRRAFAYRVALASGDMAVRGRRRIKRSSELKAWLESVPLQTFLKSLANPPDASTFLTDGDICSSEWLVLDSENHVLYTKYSPFCERVGL